MTISEAIKIKKNDKVQLKTSGEILTIVEIYNYADITNKHVTFVCQNQNGDCAEYLHRELNRVKNLTK